jgi:excisionase family DNA binding protein
VQTETDSTVREGGLVSLPETCEILGGISRTTLYRLTSSGQLGVVEIRGRAFIERDELREFIASHRRPRGTAVMAP